jgi:hypothetical protein
VSTKTKKRTHAKRKRQPVKHRQNTSTIVLYPYEVAEQLLVSEAEAYKLMAIGPAAGGIRAMCLGDPNSARPRKIVHRDDFSAFVRYKRGLTTRDQYLAELRGGIGQIEGGKE